jgi:hypothetical protein
LPLDSHKGPPFTVRSSDVVNTSKTNFLFVRASYDTGILVVTIYTLQLNVTRLDNLTNCFIDRQKIILSDENLWRRRAMASTKSEYL